MTDAGGVLLVIGFILSLNCMYIKYRSNKTDQSFANRAFYQPSIAATLASRNLHQVFNFDACFIICNYLIKIVEQAIRLRGIVVLENPISVPQSLRHEIIPA